MIELDPGKELAIAQMRAKCSDVAGELALVGSPESNPVADGWRLRDEITFDGGLAGVCLQQIHLGFLRYGRDRTHSKLIDGAGDHIAAVSCDGGVCER